MTKKQKPVVANTTTKLQKSATGISGFDEITLGGLPRGRTSLVCGEAGSGKTLFAMEFLVHGAVKFNEPGVFIAFEEKTSELATNVASLGFDLNKLMAQNKVRVDHIHIERWEIEETGEYDLEGLFIRLNHAIDSIGAKRVVLDTVENLFSSLTDKTLLRAELRRLFHWLKDKGVTAIITGEKGEGKLTREGLEEYVSDCVIYLDHRTENQISTRRLKIIKYRGSVHGTNEYPFLIDNDGISVMPVTSLKLEGKVSSQRVSSGVPSLDNMLSGKGFFRGGSILISGTAGTGKTSLAAHFVDAACKRNERTLYLAFEESPDQIKRNMRSIGLNLEAHEKKGYLKFQASRPTMYGLEMHLVMIIKTIQEYQPRTVIVDPVTNLVSVGNMSEVQSTLTRLLDYLQGHNITVMFTGLLLNNATGAQTDEMLSSLVDCWIQVRDIELNGERNKGLYIMKSRGMYHSNQVREFIISNKGVYLEDVYLASQGVLTGSARQAHQIQEESERYLQKHFGGKDGKELDRWRKDITERNRKEMIRLRESGKLNQTKKKS